MEDETEEMTEEELVAEEEVSKQNKVILILDLRQFIMYFSDGDSYSGCGG